MADAAIEGKSKRSRLHRAWRGWSWCSAHNWLGWWLGGKAGTVVGFAALGGVVGVTSIAVVHPSLLPSIFASRQPVAVVTQHWDDDVVFPIDGVDRAGRAASFDVVLKTKGITWVRASADQLEKDGQPITAADLDSELFGPEVRYRLASSKDVIGVGVASQEGTVGQETARAEKRGRAAAAWLEQALPADTRVWVLNLGQFRSNCSDATNAGTGWERPFLMIGVRRQDASVNLGEALQSAMSGKTNLPSTDCYSRYDLAKLR
jgi:hypothetical protein